MDVRDTIMYNNIKANVHFPRPSHQFSYAISWYHFSRLTDFLSNMFSVLFEKVHQLLDFQVILHTHMCFSMSNSRTDLKQIIMVWECEHRPHDWRESVPARHQLIAGIQPEFSCTSLILKHDKNRFPQCNHTVFYSKSGNSEKERKTSITFSKYSTARQDRICPLPQFLPFCTQQGMTRSEKSTCPTGK